MPDRGVPPFTISPDQTHVWVFDLGSPEHDYQFWEHFLSSEEIDRAEYYQFAADRLRFAARRGILRRLLGWYTGLDPAEIIYQVNPFGKLSLIKQTLAFNLSHSQDRIVFAFTLEKTVGVDIEQVRPLPHFSRMAEYWFSLEERASLSALPPALQLESFYHIWTQKEAYLKARGEGLSLSLKDFSVSADPNEPGKLLALRDAMDNACLWKMLNYIPETGWRVAVCVHSQADISAKWYAPALAEFLSWGLSR